MKKLLLVLPFVAALTACDAPRETSTQIERKKQEELSLQAAVSYTHLTLPTILRV